MMRANNRRSDPGGMGNEALLVWLAVTTVVTVVGSLWIAMHLGHRLAGTGAAVPMNPFDVVFGLLGGSLAWPGTAGWAVLIGIALIIVAVAVLIGITISRVRRRRSRVDRAASYMGRGRDVEGITQKQATATAKRLGVRRPASDSPSSGKASRRKKQPEWSTGVPIGKTVAGKAPLFGSWEDMHVDIWGPRTGKTTSRAVPAILDAPGSVLVTSNKRDVVDATRDVRAGAGEVWVFDPQGIAEEPSSWWWNPLSYVTDEVKAAELAGHFAAGSRDPGAKTDAYFDGDGQDLLAGLLLAAALDGRPITDVYLWTTRPTDDTPADILKAHGQELISAQLTGIIRAPEKQRGGVYGTARQMASCLTNRQVATWITPNGSHRREFSPDAFVAAGGGTLYSLSKEGRATAGPLVTALTVAVVDAAERLAVKSPGGRLQTPLLCVLDEAANVCRWAQLPSLYSHYGSRGIVLMTILQSWSQGVDVWGESGMKKLWSASNVKVYGGGVSEDGFLESLSKLIGDYDRLSSSTSHSKGQRTVSQQLHRERILDVADLGALPKGRAVVLASGSRPTLVATQPWMAGPHREAVEASIRAHDPLAERTIADADRERAAVEAELASKAQA